MTALAVTRGAACHWRVQIRTQQAHPVNTTFAGERWRQSCRAFDRTTTHCYFRGQEGSGVACGIPATGSDTGTRPDYSL